MKYDNIYDSYMNYTLKCKKLIMDSFFTDNDIEYIDYIDDNLDINDIVKNHRLKMIDIKVEHTIRMINQIVMINNNLGFKIDLDLIVKIAVLYHDIGRISQATWSNSFNDKVYEEYGSEFNNHGEEGYSIFLNNDFNIDRRFIPVVGQTILHHLDYHKYEKLKYKFNVDLSKINIDSVITGNFDLNELEWQIVSLIVQLVADIDKIDILYQHLSIGFNMIKDYVYDNSMETLNNISKKWEVPIQDIIEYNRLDISCYKPRKIKIPIKNMNLDKIKIPDYMKGMFYNNSWPELNVLKNDSNWNFVSVLWWRLSHFLNQISFTSTLISVEESKLLEQIYDKIPLDLKFLFTEAFDYANKVLVVDKIKDNKGNIYLLKK